MSDVYFNISMIIIEEITFQINSFTFMNSIIYLKFLMGGFNRTLSIYDIFKIVTFIRPKSFSIFFVITFFEHILCPLIGSILEDQYKD